MVTFFTGGDAPAHDWNERVCSECYLPNSCARILGMDGRIKTEINNYARPSFNFGPTLHRWIENHSPSLNKTLIESQSRAIAQAYNHIIMPLASEQDKLTQTVWGMEDFKYRFGRAPKGMWLPETAVDIPTLETLAARRRVYDSRPAPVQGGDYRFKSRPHLQRGEPGRNASLPLRTSLWTFDNDNLLPCRTGAGHRLRRAPQ